MPHLSSGSSQRGGAETVLRAPSGWQSFSPRSCSFGRYPKLTTIGEGRNKDQPVNRELCQKALSSPQRIGADSAILQMLHWSACRSSSPFLSILPPLVIKSPFFKRGTTTPICQSSGAVGDVPRDVAESCQTRQPLQRPRTPGGSHPLLGPCHRGVFWAPRQLQPQRWENPPCLLTEPFPCSGICLGDRHSCTPSKAPEPSSSRNCWCLAF